MRIIVTGASKGLGEALCQVLKKEQHFVLGLGFHEGEEVDQIVDITREDWVRHLMGRMPWRPNGIINCAGVNEITPFAQLDLERAQYISAVNIWGGVRLVQTFLNDLAASQGAVCNIISNASHIPMTHSLAYNVSKAGFEMATRQMAHELTREYGISVFGVSPSKIAGTGMSEYIDTTVPEMRGWTKEQAREYQLKGLLTGMELDRYEVARFIANLFSNLDRLHDLSGCVIPYGV